MKDNDYRAIRFVVDVKSEAGKFSVTVTYESGVESRYAADTLDDVRTLARRHNVEESMVLFRGDSRISIVE